MGRISALAGQHVLVVEGDPLGGSDLATELESQGAEVVGPARDVDAALSYIRSTTIDCALLDVQLAPGQDVSPIADLLAQAEVPFIFVTAHDSHDILSRHSSQPVVRKPYNGRDIIAALRAALAADNLG